MLLQHLESLRAHGEWADAHLLRAVDHATVDVAEVIRELAHVRGAQDTWLARIQRGAPTISVWPEWSATELAHGGRLVDERMRALFATLSAESLAERLTYTNLAGHTFQTPLGEILLHVLMHGHYHRGKANAALRDAGLMPTGLDYITWQREMEAASAHE